jgi:hypothetical protein
VPAGKFIFWYNTDELIAGDPETVQSIEKVVHNYMQAYQQLYRRTPSDLRILDQEWVIVNGARMRVTELEFLTSRLQQEYEQVASSKRNVLARLIKWFKT